jgi:hypothetical protein
VYNKKSKIAPGMHETILINFKPNDYSFFTSHIKLKLQVDVGRGQFLPQIQGKGSTLNRESKLYTISNDEGVFGKGAPEVFMVPIEAYPKMTLSSKKRYLPKIIGGWVVLIFLLDIFFF